MDHRDMTMERRRGYPFRFDRGTCTACAGRCCRGRPGHVWVSRQEINWIAAGLQVNVVDFMATYVRRVDNRLALLEKEKGGEYHCIFFDEKISGCAIYRFRPAQCRDFPFWPLFRTSPEIAAGECPGVRMDDDHPG